MIPTWLTTAIFESLTEGFQLTAALHAWLMEKKLLFSPKERLRDRTPWNHHKFESLTLHSRTSVQNWDTGLRKVTIILRHFAVILARMFFKLRACQSNKPRPQTSPAPYSFTWSCGNHMTSRSRVLASKNSSFGCKSSQLNLELSRDGSPGRRIRRQVLLHEALVARKVSKVYASTSDHWISLLLITIMSVHKQKAVA